MDHRPQLQRHKYLTAHPGETSTTLWLERASFDYQLSKDASFDVGARRIIGGFLPKTVFSCRRSAR